MKKKMMMVAAMVAAGVALMPHEAKAFWGLFESRPSKAEMKWYAGETADVLPFTVEFRPAHPFLAEYDKRIVFASGKRVGLCPDTGGAGAFAVYRLASGGYWLVDGLSYDIMRGDYRVDAEAETVEMLCGGKWVRIPDGAVKVTSRSGDGEIGVEMESGKVKWFAPKDSPPVANTLEDRTFIGPIHPSGRFEPDAADPLAKPAPSDGSGRTARRVARRCGHKCDGSQVSEVIKTKD